MLCEENNGLRISGSMFRWRVPGAGSLPAAACIGPNASTTLAERLVQCCWDAELSTGPDSRPWLRADENLYQCMQISNRQRIKTKTLKRRN